MPNLFVWDYHGTLCTGAEEACHKILNDVLAEFSAGEAGKEDVLRFFGMPWGHYYRYFCPSASQEQINEMISLSVRLSTEIAPGFIKPRKNLHSVLGEIKSRGDSNIIVSSTTPARLKDFIEMVQIGDYIDHFIGIPEIIEKKGGNAVSYKARKIREFAAGRFSRLFMVGDSKTDVKIGRALGAKTFLIGKDGAEADRVISSLEEVLEIYSQ